jgi:hypothetical protein
MGSAGRHRRQTTELAEVTHEPPPGNHACRRERGGRPEFQVPEGHDATFWEARGGKDGKRRHLAEVTHEPTPGIHACLRERGERPEFHAPEEHVTCLWAQGGTGRIHRHVMKVGVQLRGGRGVAEATGSRAAGATVGLPADAGSWLRGARRWYSGGGVGEGPGGGTACEGPGGGAVVAESARGQGEVRGSCCHWELGSWCIRESRCRRGQLKHPMMDATVHAD